MGKVTKGAAFIFGMLCIMFIFIALVLLRAFKVVETNDLMLAAFLTAIVGLVTSYMGIDVVNNGVRGKCYNENIPKIDAEREKNE